MHAALAIVIAILIPNVGGFLNAAFVTRRNIKPWHAHLRKPAFNPPNWLFAPTWIALYSIIGYASYRVWTSQALDEVSANWIAAFVVYGIQLALNFAWSPVFFGWHNMKGVRRVVSLCIIFNYKNVNACSGIQHYGVAGCLCSGQCSTVWMVRHFGWMPLRAVFAMVGFCYIPQLLHLAAEQGGLIVAK